LKNVIVYGASGFIGSKLVDKLCNKGYVVYAVISEEDDLDYKVCENAILIRCNLQNAKGRLSKLVNQKIDVFYDLAWDSINNGGLLSYEKQIRNVEYALDLISEAHELGVKRFVGAGSINQQELFRSEGKYSFDDKHKFYRVAMQACEDMGAALAYDYGMEFVWPLLTNVYGENEMSERLMNTLVRELLDNHEYGMSLCEQLYDFIYIDDAVEIFERLGEKGNTRTRYIIGGGNPRKLRDYISVVEKKVNTNGKVLYGMFEYKGMLYTKEEMCTDCLYTDIDYYPRVNFETGIEKMINNEKMKRCNL